MKNWIILLLSLLALQGCVDQEFDEPPFGEILAEAPEVNATIADLKALHIPGVYAEIEQDIVIRAVISADDLSGNLFRRLVIQDETGGIELNINEVELHNSFPEGREIYIKCQGLWMGDFAGVIGIGGALGETAGGDPRLNGIEPALLDQFIVKGTVGNEVAPTVKTINELGDEDISTLVQINDLQFEDSELGKSFADFQVNTNRFLEDCSGRGILIRTSGFSEFYNETLPDGNGTLTAIYNVFGDTKQLLVRRVAEVALNGTRCDGSSGGGGGGGVDPMELPDATTTIAALKATHNFGSFTNINSSDVIVGTITADDASGNFFKKIMVQDGSAGIELTINEFDLAADYGLQIGREIAINTNGLILSDFEGNISLGGTTFINNSGAEQLGGIEPNKISDVIMVGNLVNEVAPTLRSIDELNDDDIHSLVRIEDIQFTDGSAGETLADVVTNFSRNLDLEDCDGNEILIRTSSFASYAGALSPTGNGSITAIYSVFGGAKQLFIRELNDIDMNGDRCDGMTGGGSGGGGGEPGVSTFNVDFQGLQSDQIVDIDGWVNFAEEGNLANSWYVNDFDGNSYAEVTAYQSPDASNISWLITPGIEISNTASISFLLAQHHYDHAGLSVLISNNFTGDPTTASWETVDCNLPTDNDDWYFFIPSGPIMLDDYFAGGTAHIAFKYEGSSSGDDTSFLLDDVIATE